MTDQAFSTQYGVTYPNGVTEWSAADWFGVLDTPDARRSFQEQYNLKLQALGVPEQPLTFVSREVTSTYGDASTVVDVTEAIATPIQEPTP